ncbi:MAG: SUMF1/EgtB/PvdO family nonheme iron enzyme [Sulfurimonas sp.]|nr:SUMF1/EgtB/PvdO family nonheme iron enzyme [Sulfurimonas sp.]
MFKIIMSVALLSTLLLADTDRSVRLKKMKEENRVALVIGNTHYTHLKKLQNPVNDARLMRSILEKRGFDVLYKENATKRDMKKLMKKFSHKLTNGGVGLYYFAGHGVNVDGHNYLVGTNSQMDDRDEVEFETLSLNFITKKMKSAGNRLNIVILDACRNNPFGRSGGGGLAPVSNAKGMFIAYATEAGSVASDGKKGSNGVFTKYLVENIQEKGATIESVFKNTRGDVYEATNGQQSPGVYNQIRGDFYFTLPNSDTVSTQKVIKHSSFSFTNEIPASFSLNINTHPYNAKVQITNIEPKYRDGIKLKKGNYNIRVSKAGYITKRGEINLQTDMNIEINLERTASKANSKAPKNFVLIKAGSFMMGSNSGKSDEKPIHKVSIKKDFYIGKYEVTNKEFVKFLNNSNINSNWLEDRSQDSDSRIIKSSNSYSVEAGYENHPVVEVSWYGAKAYTKWLSKKTGKTYRLPTEAEWEYVARAGTTTKYSFGDSSNSLGSYVWYASNGNFKTHQIGLKKPNPWGIYDIYGNVWEWCEDWYINNYKNTPRNGSSYNNKKSKKVVRGGSWVNSSDLLRSANRNWVNPDAMHYSIGFRLLREL